LPLGRLEGVEARGHVSLVAIAIGFGLGAFEAPPPDSLDDALFGAVAFVGGVLVHELGHALARGALGLNVRRIVLYPVGGVAEGAPPIAAPGQEVAVALAGPLASLMAATALRLLDAPGHHVWVHATLGLGNLLPLATLDGAVVLKAVLSSRLSAQAAARVTAVVGQIGALAVGLVGLFSVLPWAALFAVFSFLSASAARARIGETLSGGAREGT
jgi:Zn-dependent protease